MSIMSTTSLISSQFYTVTQAATALGYTCGRIRQLLISGELAGQKVGDGENARWLIAKKELKRLGIEKNRTISKR